MKDSRQLAHADSGADDDGHFIDHFACARCHDRRPNDGIGPLLHVDLHETVVLAVGDCTIDILHHHRVALDGNAARPGVPNAHADMRDFRSAIRAPRNRQLALQLTFSAQCISRGQSPRDFRDIREFERLADVAGSVNIGVAGA